LAGTADRLDEKYDLQYEELFRLLDASVKQMREFTIHTVSRVPPAGRATNPAASLLAEHACWFGPCPPPRQVEDLRTRLHSLIEALPEQMRNSTTSQLVGGLTQITAGSIIEGTIAPTGRGLIVPLLYLRSPAYITGTSPGRDRQHRLELRQAGALRDPKHGRHRYNRQGSRSVGPPSTA
jgi:hypothetical protein